MITFRNEDKTQGKQVVTFFAGDDGLFMRVTNFNDGPTVKLKNDLATTTIQLDNDQLNKLRAYLAGEEF
jgi:hypothetical protein